MIDLTPLDVRKKRGDFRQKLRGYDPEEVDTFLELVEGRLEGLVRENRNLAEKIQILDSRLETLEGREEAVQDALVSAQALRKQVQQQAQKDAEALEERSRREAGLQLKEVEVEIESRLREAEDLLKERRRALEDLERNRRKFLKSFRSLLERELDAVEVEEARQPLEDVPLDLRLRGWKGKEKERDPEASRDDSSPKMFPVSRDPVAADVESVKPSTGEGEAPGDIDSEEGTPSGKEETADAKYPGDPVAKPLWISTVLERGDREKEDASREGAKDSVEVNPSPVDENTEGEDEELGTRRTGEGEAD